MAPMTNEAHCLLLLPLMMNADSLLEIENNNTQQCFSAEEKK